MACKTVLQFNMGRGEAAADLFNAELSLHHIDLGLVQEPYHAYKPPRGYTVYRGSENSGALTVVKNTWTEITLVTEMTDGFVTTVAVEGGNGTNRITIVNIYDRPNGGRVEGAFERFRRKLSNVTGAILIAGDLNAKNAVWGSIEDDERGEDLLRWTLAEGYDIENTSADPPSFVTCRAKGWLDLTITKGIRVEERKILDKATLSDHLYIKYAIKVQKDKNKHRKRRYDVKQANWEGLIDHLAPYADIRRDVDEMAERLQICCSEACRRNIPQLKKKEGGTCVWWNNGLKKQRIALRKSRKVYQTERDEHLRDIKYNRFIECRNAYKKDIKNAKEKAMREKLEAFAKDPWREAYKMIRRPGTPMIRKTVSKEDGQHTTSHEETVMCYLRHYFPQDKIDDDTPEIRLIRREATMTREVTWIEEITDNEVRASIESFKNGKAINRDGIPNEALRYIYQACGAEIRKLFNRCLQEGTFPKIWKKADIIWIPKKDDSLRPISLLPAIGKVLDKILARRVSHHYETRNLFDDRQYGFREGRDTTLAIDRLVDRIKKTKQRGDHTLMVTLDLSNAFNSAWAPGIIHRLRLDGVNEKLVRIIGSFLKDRMFESEGQTLSTNRGCPQGSSLGPVLWLVMMEEWFRRMGQSEGTCLSVQAFADDQVLLISGKSVKLIEAGWRDAWERCEAWAEGNKLKYNKNKTAAMFFPARGTIRPPVIRMGDETVPLTKEIKYLGVTMDPSLNWMSHVKALKGSTRELATRIYSVAYRQWKGKIACLRTIYECAIKPLLLYGSEVWGEKASGSLMRRQLRAVERPFLVALTRAYRTASTPALQVVAGTVPLEITAGARWRMAREWWEGGETMKLAKERIHPSLDGYMPTIAGEPNASYYTDASRSANGESSFAVVRIEGMNREHRGGKIIGSNSINNDEMIAVEMASKWSREQRDKTAIIYTDSKQTVDKIHTHRVRNRRILEIQKIIMAGLADQTRLQIKWLRRDSDENMREADKRAKRILLEVQEGEMSETMSRKDIGNKRKRIEIENWQQLWERETRGRWTYRLIPTVNRLVIRTDHYLTQILTGHGDFKHYLNRFGLTNESTRCTCDLDEDEDVEHVVLRCTLTRRSNARNELRIALGELEYPPPLTSLKEGSQSLIRDWARELVEGKL